MRIHSGIGIDLGIAVIYAIYAIFGHEDGVRIDFCRAQGSCRVRRKIGIPRTSPEYDDPAFFHMTDSPAADIRFCYLLHSNGCLYARNDAVLFDGILQSQGIHDRCQHAHIVGRYAVHALGFA